MRLPDAVFGAALLLASRCTGAERSEFVPIDINKAVQIGCSVAGDKGPPLFYESQVFVSYTGKQWDFRPIMSRRPDPIAAADDCIKWYQDVKRQIAEAGRASQK
jgi:hypothetical protein